MHTFQKIRVKMSNNSLWLAASTTTTLWPNLTVTLIIVYLVPRVVPAWNKNICMYILFKNISINCPNIYTSNYSKKISFFEPLQLIEMIV